jgi:hypothetical protein
LVRSSTTINSSPENTSKIRFFIGKAFGSIGGRHPCDQGY